MKRKKNGYPRGHAESVFRIRVHLQPRAAHTRIIGRHGDAIKIQVHAPPVAGAANTELCKLLADALGVPRSAVRIVHGASSRDKVVELQPLDPAACEQRLRALLDDCVDKAGAPD